MQNYIATKYPMKTKLFLTACVLFTMSQLVAQTEPVQCTLRGEFINLPNVQDLILKPASEDWQVQIPIYNGKFEYVLNCAPEDVHALKFIRKFDNWEQTLSFGFPILALSEEGVTNLIFYPNPYFKNSMPRILFPMGEQISKEDKLHWENMIKMIEPLSDTLDLVERQMGGSLIPLDRMRALQRERERVWQMMVDLVLQQAKNYPSILTFCEIVYIISDNEAFADFQIKKAIEIFNSIYALKYPNHFYTEMIKSHLQELK